MMLSKVKSGKSLLPNKDPSLKQLAALNKLLDQQQKQTTRVVKEIVPMSTPRTMRPSTAKSSRVVSISLSKKSMRTEWCWYADTRKRKKNT